MGDSETAVSDASVMGVEYPPASYTSTVYSETSVNTLPAGDGGYANVTSEVMASAENASAGQSHDGAYNTSVNGNISSESEGVSVENGIADSAGQQFVGDFVMSEKEDRFWSIVKTNSLDFDAWTALIDETERMAGDKIWKIRKVYDAFLVEFPLCFGYWKKYADHEARLGSMDKVVEVYERAVLGVTYSVDIWLHFCTFAISTYGDPDTIRRLFERGLAYVGTDYLSYPLWDKYIEYEELQGEWSRVAMIYTRTLDIPNRHLDDYLNRFKAFAASRPLSELWTAEEAAATAPPAPPQDIAQENEGESHLNTEDQASKSVSAGLTEAEELEKYIAIREEIYKKAKEFDSKISDFENAIRRPYFHVRPLNIAELENWHNYLDFIEREGDINKIVKLYERCLIACANYPEYWVRYVLCMEACESMDLANNALARATQVFVKRQPEIHVFAARFREQNGDVSGARAAYQLIHNEIAPGLLDAIVKHANMEHRQGNLEEAYSTYERAIAIEKGKENSQALPILYAQYARFLFLVSGNAEKSREIFAEAIDNVQLSKPILEAIIHFESIQPLPKRIEYLDSLVEKFIFPSTENLHLARAAEREELSCIFLEFLGIFGNAQSIKKAEDRHAKLFLAHRSKSDSRKRHAEDFLASDKSKVAKAYPDGTSPAQSLMGAYASAQNPWVANYGMQSQAWPPSTQASVQPWTAGYGQVAYGTYSSYAGGYNNSQAPASVPQAAAYGGYSSTYPAQAVPQLSYAQPTAGAAVAAPVQQPAPAPQPYYGGYY